jgi:hypothetical protein
MRSVERIEQPSTRARTTAIVAVGNDGWRIQALTEEDVILEYDVGAPMVFSDRPRGY